MLTAFFSKLQQETLKEQGFCSTEVTGNAAKATLKGILYAAPFFIFLTGIYHIFLSHRATMPDMAGARMFLIPAAVWAISTLLHQALHGIGWAILGKAGWDSISFHKNGSPPIGFYGLIFLHYAWRNFGFQVIGMGFVKKRRMKRYFQKFLVYDIMTPSM